ncbi:12-oxophytodienoate reductase [Caulobacter mirabilis]|uniref:12-oxophytodienoate reductase n=1 Tax=Caulobacter mirabilis TaxID=69666 RepID=A0A2D2B1N1_9CAUL|nr:12-oxophytodienoate reductase [Caulobacter mirabilis]ATQ44172.1 12-oxophytodienoate reductase [Caulobacter mirabilis]
MSVEALFRPFAARSLRTANRIAMASMARWAAPGGDPAPLEDFYRRRIEGGAGLILTEGVNPDRPAAGNDPCSLKLHGPALGGWRTVIDAVQGAGGAIVPQLWHCGATAKPGQAWTPSVPFESPSGRQAPGLKRGVVMDEAAVEATIAAFAQAAAEARALGFDGVEIHAGHGYLLDQFQWRATNDRTDRWGGATLAERSRFPLAAVKAVRAAVGPDFAVLLRVSQWKSADLSAQLVETPSELEAWLGPFVDAGVDVISASQLRWDQAEFEGSPLGLAGWVRTLLGVPTIVAGGVGMSGDFIRTFGGETGAPEPVEEISRRLDAGEFDLVAVGRGMLADADWANRVREGRPRTNCPPSRLFAGVV